MPTKYGLFYRGLVSAPTAVGLINWTNGEIATMIQWDCDTSKENRAKYEKYSKILELKYSSILLNY